MRKIICLSLLFFVFFLLGCIGPDRALQIYCGNTMRPAMELLAKSYEAKTGVKTEFSFGDSSELFAQVELSKKGDLFIVHEPYMEQFSERGLIAEYKDIAFLQPVLVVASGNPRKINGLENLAKKGIRLGWGEPEFSLAGKLTEDYLKQEKMYETLSKNLKVKTRSSSELANAVKLKTLDAAFIWNASVKQFSDSLKQIKLQKKLPAARVSLVVLKSSVNSGAAKDFLDYAASDEGRAAFIVCGFKSK